MTVHQATGSPKTDRILVDRADLRLIEVTTPPGATAIRMGPQHAHSFHNTDTFPAHFYRVEFKKIQFKG